MAIFARRVIARCLRANASFASPEKLRDWAKRLDTVSDDYVATEWEIVLLSAFAGFGNVRYEPPIGPRPIDLIFESSDQQLQFAADITAISDDPLHKKNPIEQFGDELRRRVAKAKIT